MRARLLGSFSLILSLTFFHRVLGIMAQTLNPLYVKDALGASLTEVGLTTTIFSVATLLMMYMFSASVRVSSIPHAVIAGFIMHLGSTIGYYFSPNLITYYGSIALMGLSGGILHPLIMTLVTLASPPRNLERNLALYTVALSVSLVLGPVIQSVLLIFFDPRSIFVFWSACALVSIGFSFLLSRQLGSSYHEKVHQDRATNAKSVGFMRHLRRVLSIRIFVIIMVVDFGTSIFYNISVTFGGVYAREAFSASYANVMTIFASMCLMGLIARAILAAKAPIRRKMLTLELLTLGGVFASLLAFLAPALEIFMLGFFLLGVRFGTYSIAITVVTQNVEADNLAFANSMIASTPCITGILLPPVVGFLAESYGIQMAALLALIPTPLFVVLLLEITRRPYDAEIKRTPLNPP